MQTNRQKLPADFEIIMNKLNRSTLKRWSIETIIFPIMLLPLAFGSCHKADPEPIPVVKKLDESVTLQNKIELVYKATRTNVNSAKLVVNKDGVLVFSEEINDVTANGPYYLKTFKYVKDDPILKNFTKGKYEFILTSDDFVSDKLEKKTSIEIINYIPTANTTTLDQNKLNFNEAFVTTLSIPKTIFSDDNPEDNPVSVTGVKSVDGKTTPTITTTSTGYNLNIKSANGTDGAYQLELDFGSTTGGLEKTILSGTIGKDTRIVINPRKYVYDATAPFNFFTEKSDKDNIILAGVNAEPVVPYSSTYYDCANYAMQLIANTLKSGQKILSPDPWCGDVWLYNNSTATDIPTIYANGGTQANMGTVKAPILWVSVSDKTHIINYPGHAMCASLTGSDLSTGDLLTNFYNYNIISPEDKKTNVMSGWYSLPLSCDKVTFSYPCVIEKADGNSIILVPLASFSLDNGNPTLLWENTDSITYNIIKQ